MQFKKFTAGTQAYGTDEMPKEKQEPNVCFMDPRLNQHIEEGCNEYLEKTLVFLACCHTIIIDQKTNEYNSSSPDELALVNAAKQFGYNFVNRNENDEIIITKTD